VIISFENMIVHKQKISMTGVLLKTAKRKQDFISVAFISNKAYLRTNE